MGCAQSSERNEDKDSGVANPNHGGRLQGEGGQYTNYASAQSPASTGEDAGFASSQKPSTYISEGQRADQYGEKNPTFGNEDQRPGQYSAADYDGAQRPDDAAYGNSGQYNADYDGAQRPDDAAYGNSGQCPGQYNADYDGAQSPDIAAYGTSGQRPSQYNADYDGSDNATYGNKGQRPGQYDNLTYGDGGRRQQDVYEGDSYGRS
jgi:hypothetical protein